jgi:hypothetical protein
MPDGFLVYRDKHLRKVNAIRMANSQPTIDAVPILQKGKVLFVTAAEMDNEPASCANCVFYNSGRSCQLIGPRITVRKFTYPPKATADAKPIEYWPCCGMHTYGEPNYGAETFAAKSDPAELDLVWINAPSVGLEHGGANCGGENGGDDCDHYLTAKDDKRDSPTGFCRVLQAEVCNGDVCAAWMDDDEVSWDRAQALIKELDS